MSWGYITLMNHDGIADIITRVALTE